MKTISSRDNAVFKALSKLTTSSAERRRKGLSLIEGEHLLQAFLDAGTQPESIAVKPAALENRGVARLLERSSAPVTVLSEALFNTLSAVESPTGVIAVVKTPGPKKVPATAPLVLLLEDIQDPGNVGTLLRSAAAAGAGHVLLSERCAFAWSPKVLRSAMGAHFALNIVEAADLAAFVGAYRGTTIALSADAQASLYDLDLRGAVAFLVGNEGAGLSEGLKAAATHSARIPMPGRAESLNAAVAASVCLFETIRQRHE